MSTQSGYDVYRGEEEKIVIAIDAGTTQTAVSFTYLYPQEIIETHMVTDWPGQVPGMGDSKIPSLVAYQNRAPKAFAIEANSHREDPGYELAEWFKLHLHPSSMHDPTTSATLEKPPLPSRVSIVTIYADFLRHIYEHTETHFKETIPNGPEIWNRAGGNSTIVLAIPNGWDAKEQGILRAASIKGGLITEDDADSRLEFVTEAEASVHYVLKHTQNKSWLRPGVIFAVTDAGGSTVDSTLYKCTRTSPTLVLQEVTRSECVQAGGVFVDRAAKAMLQSKLVGSRFGTDEYIKPMIEEFEAKTKRLFDGKSDRNVIKFGGLSDDDSASKIFRGRITLSKQEMLETFTPAVQSIIRSVSALVGNRNVQHLILVGGFGDSPYLRQRLRDEFGSRGTQLVAIEQTSKKAAAEGAAIWFPKQLVAARAVRFTLGTCVSRTYDPSNAEDRSRLAFADYGDDGELQTRNLFDPLVERDELLSQDHKVVKDYICTWKHDQKPELGFFGNTIYAWEGSDSTTWTTDDSGAWLSDMRHRCFLRADLSGLASSLTIKEGKRGARYRQVDFRIAMCFGGTKMRAWLEWEEGNVTRKGPVRIVTEALV